MLSIAGARAAVVEGQVFDNQGRALAGLTVHVIERTGGQLAPAVTGPEREQDVGRGETDAGGFFRIDLGGREIRGQVLVRCYDPAKWDAVRYTPAADRDITDTLRSRDHVLVMCRTPDAPGWPALSREIERAGGPESDRGRVLRRMGLPPETVFLANGQNEWRYPSVTFVFRDGVLLETKPAAAPAGRSAPTEASSRKGGTR